MDLSSTIHSHHAEMLTIVTALSATGIIMLVALFSAYLLRNQDIYTKLIPLCFSVVPAMLMIKMGAWMTEAKLSYLVGLAHLKETGVAIPAALETKIAAYGVTTDTVVHATALSNPPLLVAAILFVLVVAFILYKK